MSKPNHKAARLGSGGTAAINPAVPSAATGRHSANELKTQTHRGVQAGGVKRDTHPSFSTGKVHRDGGRAGPLGAAGRKGGPKSAGSKPAGTK